MEERAGVTTWPPVLRSGVVLSVPFSPKITRTAMPLAGGNLFKYIMNTTCVHGLPLVAVLASTHDRHDANPWSQDRLRSPSTVTMTE